MSVNGVGGAAALPLSVTGSGAPAATGTSAASASVGAVRLPGQHQTAEDAKEARDAKAAAQARLKEATKPVPPLKGLTVAEIRAMLGVPPLPGQTGGEPVPPTATSASQTYQRYA